MKGRGTSAQSRKTKTKTAAALLSFRECIIASIPAQDSVDVVSCNQIVTAAACLTADATAGYMQALVYILWTQIILAARSSRHASPARC